MFQGVFRNVLTLNDLLISVVWSESEVRKMCGLTPGSPSRLSRYMRSDTRTGAHTTIARGRVRPRETATRAPRPRAPWRGHRAADPAVTLAGMTRRSNYDQITKLKADKGTVEGHICERNPSPL